MRCLNFWFLLWFFLFFNFTEAEKIEGNIQEKNSEEISENNDKDDDTFYNSLKKLEIPDSFTLKEVIIGTENAPVTLVVYSSFTCNHCRNFHLEIFPKFKKKYIDSGKVKVYLRNYLDDVAALEASILIRCVGKDKSETILKMYREIFENQKKWMRSNEPREFLKKIFIDSGYESRKIDACLQDKKIPAGLMKEQQRAMQQLHIFSVPAFVRSDGKIHIGKITLEELEEFLALKNDPPANEIQINRQNIEKTIANSSPKDTFEKEKISENSNLQDILEEQNRLTKNPNSEAKTKATKDKDKTILEILKELLDFKKIRKKLKIELRNKKKKSKSNIEDQDINKAITAA